MTGPDPFAEVRAEFVTGLARRVETMQGALAGLESRFHVEQAETLYRTAHSLSGTAASFGAEDLVMPPAIWRSWRVAGWSAAPR